MTERFVVETANARDRNGLMQDEYWVYDLADHKRIIKMHRHIDAQVYADQMNDAHRRVRIEAK